MRFHKNPQEYYRNILKEVLALREYISCLHPVNQKSLIKIFNDYFTTGEVEYDYGKLKAIHDILLNYKGFK